MKKYTLILFACFLCFVSCRPEKKKILQEAESSTAEIKYATGFQLTNYADSTTLLQVSSPWPGADKTFRYLLVPRSIDLDLKTMQRNVDAVIQVPVKKFIATSTTHVPALESLGALEGMVGFPGTQYISSDMARSQIDSGRIRELGANESLNTEMTLALNPEVVFGFSISDQNSSYKFLEDAGIPVIYNGDWTEHSPLGKAEWIRFFAPFFGKEQEADSIFAVIERNYQEAKQLASRSKEKPSVMSGALYKDVWYLPGGNSWAAQFIKDAHADYIWADTPGTGSLSLSLEHVLERATDADIWISPSQFTSLEEMRAASSHYAQFKPIKQKKIYTYALKKGVTGGLIYFESAPQRPDLVLKDLIHIFHPDLMPSYQLHFFSPLE